MFSGEYQHSVDPKGRLIMPSKFREGLGEKFMITRGLDDCLFVYSMTDWESFETKLKSLPMTDNNARAFVRFFLSGATECELDKQGRILVPQNLRDYAGIDKDVAVVGVSSRVEIWDKDKWQKYICDVNANPNELAKNLTSIGLVF
ncbi:MAG TPA: division/cell wall cluster transcriptional repressor MraZ [Pseudobacteroides sp.]|uniref:division/cell wall cluster transcriptional repressor MraZ n=1 Tax=Pseudobacteroides sp. TaxID=1968840 RepID=UPI002F94FAD6